MDVLNNYEIWGLMGVDSTCMLTILHVPTAVTNQTGSTMIRGFSGMFLVSNLEIDTSIEYLLDTTTTADPVQVDPPNSVLAPLIVNKHNKAVKGVGNTTWSTTRAPLMTLLVGNVKVLFLRAQISQSCLVPLRGHTITSSISLVAEVQCKSCIVGALIRRFHC